MRLEADVDPESGSKVAPLENVSERDDVKWRFKGRS